MIYFDTSALVPLHSAIARGAGASTLVTLDHSMAAAAARPGVPVASPA
jgi:hypothetical protein